MFVFTSNIKDNPDMPDRWVREDMRAVRRWAGSGTRKIGAFQEIGPEDIAALKATFPAANWVRVGKGDECPIVVQRAGFRVDEFQLVPMHGGKHAVTPHRITSRALIRTRFRVRRLPRFRTLAKHTVSGAFTHPGQVAEDWRREHWAIDKRKTEQLMLDDIANGVSGIVLGDLNRYNDGWEYDVPGFRWVAHHKFDHIGVWEAPGGLRFHVDDIALLSTTKLHTDHAALGAQLTLIRP